MDMKSIRAIAFVIRCSGAATAAFELATAFGLPQAVWAAMSALIVSQERLLETRAALTGRILGTLLGAGVTVIVSEIASRAGTPVAAQMAIAIAICALIAREYPRYRVAMWTCAVVLLTAQHAAPIELVALRRATEVILGAIVGWTFHFAAEAIVHGLLRQQGCPRLILTNPAPTVPSLAECVPARKNKPSPLRLRLNLGRPRSNG
ncbi:MAG: FUSC family protein [Candidatus Eremiobacteraeota bacterium]|nr:FUSC family protein [Candidatus Eremiobacteraeota bacterium]